MRFFFRSKQFKIIAAVFSFVLILSVVFTLIGKRMSPTADAAGIITSPFRKAYSSLSAGIKDFFTAYNDGNDLMIKNSELKKDISDLRKKIADYDKLKSENDFYKDYLGIKEKNPDFNFVSASVISRDSIDEFDGFLINKGSASGIKENDTVITDEGLVGKISEVGTTTAKVSTLLSPEVKLGALDSRTNDSGIVTGNIQLSEDNMCRFANLSRTCGVAIGDFVVTSGEGIFPDGLLIGSIQNIGNDKYNSSIYADIEPFVDFSSIRKVMVITDFEGKGGISPKKD